MTNDQEKARPDKRIVRARRLRRRQTEAEKLLWYHLRNKRLVGYKFRRQHPIETYIVDFFCDAARLVIEIDGGGHTEPSQRAYDNERTSRLEELGLRVMRFWNDDVLTNTNQVLEVILEDLEYFTSPCPSPRRRGDSDREQDHGLPSSCPE